MIVITFETEVTQLPSQVVTNGFIIEKNYRLFQVSGPLANFALILYLRNVDIL